LDEEKRDRGVPAFSMIARPTDTPIFWGLRRTESKNSVPYLLARSAAFVPRKPNAGFLGAATRGPAALGTISFLDLPSTYGASSSLPCFYRSPYVPFVVPRHLLSEWMRNRSLIKNQMWLRRTVWNPTLRKSSEGWGRYFFSVSEAAQFEPWAVLLQC
jgi:hypothetical protein